MAGSVCKVIIVGNLGADPEIKSFSNGGKVANLRVATSESWKDKSTGEKKEKTEWHRVSIFNEHLVKVCENYLAKGSTVYLEGQLQTRKWTDQAGVEKFSTEVILQRFDGKLTILSGKPERGEQAGEDGFRGGNADGFSGGGRDGGRSNTGRGGSSAKESYDLNDDIPF